MGSLPKEPPCRCMSFGSSVEYSTADAIKNFQPIASDPTGSNLRQTLFFLFRPSHNLRNHYIQGDNSRKRSFLYGVPQSGWSQLWTRFPSIRCGPSEGGDHVLLVQRSYPPTDKLTNKQCVRFARKQTVSDEPTAWLGNAAEISPSSANDGLF